MAKKGSWDDDFYTKKAQKEGYPARSVYKLQEIQQKFNVIKKDFRVLDVGAAPGSWSMYIMKFLGNTGFLSAIDLKPLGIQVQNKNFFFIQGDAFSQENIQALAEKGPYNAVLSDAAPSTTGNKIVDTERSIQLIESIYNTALQVLLPGGNFVFKMFQGGKEKEILESMRKNFNSVKILKPQASRTNSFETFVIGLGKK
ncbi:MAG: RlmE family RNA methyltransferase [Spirochaetia bacterium]|nr:RlmE family RNA methyltransferase [Spirochaetia bacterium]